LFYTISFIIITIVLEYSHTLRTQQAVRVVTQYAPPLSSPVGVKAALSNAAW